MKMNKKILKRGVSVYISWVLVMAFMILLGSLMFTWIINQVGSQTEKFSIIGDEQDCKEIFFSIDESCQDDFKVFVDISNTRNHRIDGFKIILFDIYDDFYESSIDFSINPGKTDKISLLKHGTLNVIEMIPYFYSDDKKKILCQNSKVSVENIKRCE